MRSTKTLFSGSSGYTRHRHVAQTTHHTHRHRDREHDARVHHPAFRRIRPSQLHYVRQTRLGSRGVATQVARRASHIQRDPPSLLAASVQLVVRRHSTAMSTLRRSRTSALAGCRCCVTGSVPDVTCHSTSGGDLSSQKRRQPRVPCNRMDRSVVGVGMDHDDWPDPEA